MSDINVYTGPMKCGKTKLLISKYSEYKKNDYKCIMFKPYMDNRFSTNKVIDRDGEEIECMNIQKVDELERYAWICDVFFIDEFQFLSGDINVIHTLVNKGKKFYIAGLNMTAEKEPFGLMGSLLCIADNIKLLEANCDYCNKPAKYTLCTVDKNDAILVGEDMYKAVCHQCYEKFKNKKTSV